MWTLVLRPDTSNHSAFHKWGNRKWGLSREQGLAAAFWRLPVSANTGSPVREGADMHFPCGFFCRPAL